MVFEKAKVSENVIGAFDSKKGKFNDIKKAKIPDKTKSTVCTIV